MRLHVDNEFQQVKTKDLNEMNDVEMFTTSVGGGKAFAAEQKIRELETRISILNAQKLIILNSAINMKNFPSDRYGLTPEESISIERFRTIFKMHRIKRTKLVHHKKSRYDKKNDRKKKNMRKNLSNNKKVLVLAERIRKSQLQKVLQFVQNISYFNKDKIFFIRHKIKIDKISYYWIRLTK